MQYIVLSYPNYLLNEMILPTNCLKFLISHNFGPSMNLNPTKYLFVINPGSGNQQMRNWNELITNNLNGSDFEILISKDPGHSKSVIAQYQDAPNLCIVAVGGDGTVSALAKTVFSRKASLGIIPTGSGNGLARHLKIPIDPAKAIRKLSKGTAQKIDLVQVNDQYCCNTCGIGFSAFVTKHFGKAGKRGFSTYFKLAFTLYQSSKNFDIQINEKIFQNVWSVEIANSSQMGNNAVVSPLASVSDGLMDILIMSKPKFWQIPGLILMVFSKNIMHSKLSSFVRATNAKITLKEDFDYHIDGDYKGQANVFDFKVLPSSLTIIF